MTAAPQGVQNPAYRFARTIYSADARRIRFTGAPGATITGRYQSTVETKIDVRYPDIDAMGIVHHAVYPIWYEMARMDMLAAVGFTYAEARKLGIDTPLVNLTLGSLKY